MATETNLEDYTDSDRTDHEIAKIELARRLRGRGYDERISGRKLAEHVPVSESTVRDLVAELREEHRLPVFSSGSGYYCITDADELADALAKINDEIATRERTKQNLTAAYNRQ